MKTLKRVTVQVVEVSTIPPKEEMEFGKIYYSEQYHGSNHLCLCGCGEQCYLPHISGEWGITITDGKVSITPSILQRYECRSHYIITNNIANFV